jgi:hypothetical protein
MIDIKKKYKTRSGLDVLLISDQGRGSYPIVGYVGLATTVTTWTDTGICDPDVDYHPFNLVEVKEKKVMYVLIDEYGDISSSQNADEQDKRFYVTRIRVEYEEGQFDE